MLKQKDLIFALTFLLLSACAPAVSSAQPAPATQAPSQAPADATATLEPVTIKVGLTYASSNLPIYIAEAEGFYAEQGLNVEIIPIASPAEALVAVIQGETDVSGGAIWAGMLNAAAEGSGLKLVSDKGYNDPNGCAYSTWLVRNEVLDSGLLDDMTNITDLTVFTARGGEYWMDRLLEPVGLSIDDLNLVEIPFESLVEALRNEAIDVAVGVEPMVTRALNAGVAQIWNPWNVYMPDTQVAVLSYGPTLTEQNRDAGNRFMIAYRKGVTQYNEGKTERNVELMAEFTQLDIEEARGTCWQSFTADGSINFESVLDYQSWAVEKGQIEAVVPAEAFWDGSFLEYANQSLE
jgi:NitT/TauT family transport system substrate-binding protein